MKTWPTVVGLILLGAAFMFAAVRIADEKIGDADRHYVRTK